MSGPVEFANPRSLCRSTAVWIVFLAFSLLAAPIASGADEVLTVSDLIQRRAELNGKIVTVRGLYLEENVHGGILVPLHESEYIDEHPHIIDFQADDFPLRDFYGHLERSHIAATGTVRYLRDCDYVMGRSQGKEEEKKEKEEDTDIITVCHMRSPVHLHSISELRIVDTFSRDDPRVWSLVEFEPLTVNALQNDDPEHSRITALAHRWKRAIQDGDVRRLALLSLDAEDRNRREISKRIKQLSDRSSSFYNIVFRGTKSLQARLRRYPESRTFIGFVHNPHDDASERKSYRYSYYLNICYCLQKECTDADFATLRYPFYGSNLKDPFWCFNPRRSLNHQWSMPVYGYISFD